MRTRVLFKVAALAGMLALTGCASKLAQPNQYSGFLKDYSNLKEATTASGKSELRWIDPNYNPANYDNVVYHPVTYYPVPKPTTQVGEKALQDILNYTNKQLKQAISERKPLDVYKRQANDVAVCCKISNLLASALQGAGYATSVETVGENPAGHAGRERRAGDPRCV